VVYYFTHSPILTTRFVVYLAFLSCDIPAIRCTFIGSLAMLFLSPPLQLIQLPSTSFKYHAPPPKPCFVFVFYSELSSHLLHCCSTAQCLPACFDLYQGCTLLMAPIARFPYAACHFPPFVCSLHFHLFISLSHHWLPCSFSV